MLFARMLLPTKPSITTRVLLVKLNAISGAKVRKYGGWTSYGSLHEGLEAEDC